ncbi:unnamed protein product [Acanthoscelides obtectus]|uniref:Uncharacterized protein n=1 Tax=Acanthoscelides obtectus TaxID=200917 RepID=A0A9P0KJV4_ACAOB|nr:unnamed protein product [Acanthoscelides obtectus]CAK1682032.1 hypothetical protein AOBTE_LOCUS33389 [Acanthoscelides obtectus]
MSVDEAQSTGITKTKERIVEDKNEYIVEKESEKIIEDKIQIATNTNNVQELIEPENNCLVTSNNNQTTPSLEISATSSDRDYTPPKLVDYSNSDSDEMPTKSNKRKKKVSSSKSCLVWRKK